MGSDSEEDTFYGLNEGEIVFDYSGLPSSMPEEERSNFLKEQQGKSCSHCHQKPSGAWVVKQNMKNTGKFLVNFVDIAGHPLYLGEITHLGACKSFPDRKCVSSANCGHQHLHKNEVAEEKEKKAALKEAKKVLLLETDLIS